MIKAPVYLDYAASTPCDPEVCQVMIDCLTKSANLGNPASKDHVYGWQAAEIVEQARDQVSKTVGTSPINIIFTSGATESSNMAIIGLARGLKDKDQRRHIITTLIEHNAVLKSCEYLEHHGYKVTYIKPYKDGSVDVKLLSKYVDDDTFLVSIAQANSVVGTINDVKALASFCHEKGIYYHTDCAQSAGWEDLSLDKTDIDLVSLTPEKIYGPKGVGAIYIKKPLDKIIEPLIFGGGQEKGLRAGTVAVHQVAAMGKAFELIKKRCDSDKKYILSLREKLKNALLKLDGVYINGSDSKHLPGVLSVTFPGIDSHMLLPTLKDVAASTGSACSSASLVPSYVLKALDLSDNDARSSLRLSIGRFTTEDEIDRAILDITNAYNKLKTAGSMWNIKK